MLKRAVPVPAPRVTLLEDRALDIRVSARGDRPAGQPCQLTLAVNGAEALSFLEDAGAGAPLSVLIDMALPLGPGRAVLDALSTRPWLHSDVPVIISARSEAVAARRGEAAPCAIAYLVRNRPVDDLITLIRDALDLAPHQG